MHEKFEPFEIEQLEKFMPVYGYLFVTKNGCYGNRDRPLWIYFMKFKVSSHTFQIYSHFPSEEFRSKIGYEGGRLP